MSPQTNKKAHSHTKTLCIGQILYNAQKTNWTEVREDHKTRFKKMLADSKDQLSNSSHSNSHHIKGTYPLKRRFVQEGRRFTHRQILSQLYSYWCFEPSWPHIRAKTGKSKFNKIMKYFVENDPLFLFSI